MPKAAGRITFEMAGLEHAKDVLMHHLQFSAETGVLTGETQFLLEPNSNNRRLIRSAAEFIELLQKEDKRAIDRFSTLVRRTRWQFGPQGFHFIAKDALGNVAGFCSVPKRITQNQASVGLIYIQPEYRRMGVASGLLQTVLSEKKYRNSKGIYLKHIATRGGLSLAIGKSTRSVAKLGLGWIDGGPSLVLRARSKD